MEREPEEAVKTFLASLDKKERASLRRPRAARQIAEQLGISSEETIDQIDYLLGEALRSSSAKSRQTEAILGFLESDIDHALDEAIDRALLLLTEEPKKMERLIEDIAVEVQRLIQQAKLEFGMQTELERLEETYSLPAIDKWLRRKLHLIELARFHQEVSRALSQSKHEEIEKIAERAAVRVRRAQIEPRIESALIAYIEESAQRISQGKMIQSEDSSPQ